MTTTPPAVQHMLDWQKANAGKLHYSETASTRLACKTAADLLTPTDCSGNVARLHEYFNHQYIGTYTGNIIQHGWNVTTSKSAARSGYGMLPGDLILFDWNGDGRPDHVAMYAGGGEIWNHGGPGNGPELWNLQHNVDAAHQVWVRRYIAPLPGTVTHPPVVAGTPTNPLHGHPVPALIARGTGDYFGPITGPNESHGGAYSSERPWIELIQKFLNWKEKAGLKVDGIFGSATVAAVSRFQHSYMPGTEFYGQVWFDDWSKMASF